MDLCSSIYFQILSRSAIQIKILDYCVSTLILYMIILKCFTDTSFSLFILFNIKTNCYFLEISFPRKKISLKI